MTASDQSSTTTQQTLRERRHAAINAGVAAEQEFAEANRAWWLARNQHTDERSR